eukprot:7391038-Prymnesium_polylepis.1
MRANKPCLVRQDPRLSTSGSRIATMRGTFLQRPARSLFRKVASPTPSDCCGLGPHNRHGERVATSKGHSQKRKRAPVEVSRAAPPRRPLTGRDGNREYIARALQLRLRVAPLRSELQLPPDLRVYHGRAADAKHRHRQPASWVVEDDSLGELSFPLVTLLLELVLGPDLVGLLPQLSKVLCRLARRELLGGLRAPHAVGPRDRAQIRGCHRLDETEQLGQAAIRLELQPALFLLAEEGGVRQLKLRISPPEREDARHTRV